jgi:hypothetical protein
MPSIDHRNRLARFWSLAETALGPQASAARRFLARTLIQEAISHRDSQAKAGKPVDYDVLIDTLAGATSLWKSLAPVRTTDLAANPFYSFKPKFYSVARNADIFQLSEKITFKSGDLIYVRKGDYANLDSKNVRYTITLFVESGTAADAPLIIYADPGARLRLLDGSDQNGGSIQIIPKNLSNGPGIPVEIYNLEIRGGPLPGPRGEAGLEDGVRTTPGTSYVMFHNLRRLHLINCAFAGHEDYNPNWETELAAAAKKVDSIDATVVAAAIGPFAKYAKLTDGRGVEIMNIEAGLIEGCVFDAVTNLDAVPVTQQINAGRFTLRGKQLGGSDMLTLTKVNNFKVSHSFFGSAGHVSLNVDNPSSDVEIVGCVFRNRLHTCSGAGAHCRRITIHRCLFGGSGARTEEITKKPLEATDWLASIQCEFWGGESIIAFNVFLPDPEANETQSLQDRALTLGIGGNEACPKNFIQTCASASVNWWSFAGGKQGKPCGESGGLSWASAWCNPSNNPIPGADGTPPTCGEGNKVECVATDPKLSFWLPAPTRSDGNIVLNNLILDAGQSAFEMAAHPQDLPDQTNNYRRDPGSRNTMVARNIFWGQRIDLTYWFNPKHPGWGQTLGAVNIQSWTSASVYESTAGLFHVDLAGFREGKTGNLFIDNLIGRRSTNPLALENALPDANWATWSQKLLDMMSNQLDTVVPNSSLPNPNTIRALVASSNGAESGSIGLPFWVEKAPLKSKSDAVVLVVKQGFRTDWAVKMPRIFGGGFINWTWSSVVELNQLKALAGSGTTLDADSTGNTSADGLTEVGFDPIPKFKFSNTASLMPMWSPAVPLATPSASTDLATAANSIDKSLAARLAQYMSTSRDFFGTKVASSFKGAWPTP